MKSLADAVVYAVTYINCRPDPEERFLDGDSDALTDIAVYLHQCTDQEKQVLADAAERSLAGWRAAGSPRPDWEKSLSTFMEDIYGDEWQGNKRVGV